jgi:DNA-directed RNA polymerase specialized sigma subunit
MAKRISYETVAPLIDSGQDCKAVVADQLDTLKVRCRLLSGTDRVLMELFLQGQCKYADLAALLGIAESTLARRIRRLLAMLGGQYSMPLQHRGRISSLEWKIARLAFLDRRTIRQIAGHTGLSFYRVRQITLKFKKTNPRHEKHGYRVKNEEMEARN